MPKVSVIVPVYNVSTFLAKCLDSLVNQTLKDIEIIIVNDGSTDDSQTVIDTYAAKYPKNIKAYTKQNGGLSDARNFGMKKATGDFIGFVDSDDFVDVTMYEKLYTRAIETDSDIVICAHNAIILGKENEIKSSNVREIEKADLYGSSIYDSHGILAHSGSYAWNKLYKREILQGFEFPVGQFFEDSAVVYNILSKARKIELVNEPLYNYIVGRTGAITRTVDTRVFDIFKSCNSIINYYKGIGKFELLKSEIEFLCLLHIHARFALFSKRGGFALKIKFVDAAYDFFEEFFPNWKQNKYYVERRAVKLAIRPVRPFYIARESRLTLKMYYFYNHAKKVALRALRKLKKLLKLKK